MKIIKVSDAVHKQLKKDKKTLSEKNSYTFRFNDVINEYQKIIGLIKREEEE